MNSSLTIAAICNDGTVNYTPTSATTGTTYSWTRAAVTDITPSTGSGTGGITETLHNAGSVPQVVTYIYTLTANGCTAPTTEEVKVTVNPTPKLSSSLTIAEICNDGTVTYTPTSATAGTTYSWTRAAVTDITPSIGNGTGGITETLHNAGSAPQVVTYVYTLSANGCTAPVTEEVKVTVNPTPKLNSSLTIAAICNDGTVTYTPTSATSGTSYVWTRTAVTGITPSTATGNGGISETLHNATADPVTVTYIYTLSANGCTAPATEEVKVVVNPTPKLSSPLTIAAICNDGTVNYVPASATTGTTYTWTRAAVNHITPATGNGIGNINETLHNDGLDPVTVTYIYTLSANGCTAPATEEVKVVVNPTPKLSSPLTITAICNDGTVTYTPASATAGTTYSWTRAAVTDITPSTASGTGGIAEALHNAGTAPQVVTYIYTLSANGCTAPTTEEVKVVVNPTPKLSSALTIAAICNDGTVNYTPASATTGTSFAWSRPAVTGIIPATGNGTGNISETLHNDSADPITVTYIYTLSANSCTAPATEEVKVVVNPTPKLSSALTIAAICNDGTVNYTPISATTGTAFTWSRRAVTGITPATGNGTGNISETLHNDSADPITVTYIYTLSANGCTAPTTEEVKVTVNPTPKLSSPLTIAAICNEGTVSYTPTSATTGTSFAWSRPAIAGITPATGNGTGNISETLHNDSTDPITVTYIYTLAANGCTAPATEEVKVVVNPTPKLSSALTIAAICNDGTVSYTPISATTGTTYSWTRAAVTDITPATSNGTGNINEVLHNGGANPQEVTYVYTLSANGCTAPTTEEVKVVVNPTPKLNSPLTIAAICNDGTVSYTPTSATTGTTYNWTRAAVTDITPATSNGTGNINEALHNGGANPQEVTYVYTLAANGCTAPTTEEVKVIVNPTPKLSSALTIAAICNDGTVNYTPTSATTGTTFTWSRPAVTGITPATGSGTGNINETLHNATADPVTVTYIYTLTANGCTAPATEEVKVVVNPTPKLSSPLTIAAICNDGTVSYTPTSATTGTTYTWTRAAINHITPATGNGTGNINEILHNDGTDPVTVTYVYTLTANGCTVPTTEEVKVVVNPTPKLNSALTIAAICNDGTVNYTPTSATTGTTYSWTRATVTDIAPATGTGTGSINETLHNGGANPQVVTYVYTLSANGCTAPATEEVKVTVNPTPKLSSALTIAAICNDGTVNYTPASATAGTTYTWTRSAVSGITPSVNNGNGNISEALHNATTDPVTVTYVYTLSANGCTAPTTEEVKVVVNPTPKLSSALTITAICNDGTVNYTPASATSGTTYTWTRAAVNHITPATGNGTGNINEVLHNDGSDPVTVTYIYSLTANGCAAPTTEEVKVVVNPTPKLNSPLSITAICNDGTASYTPASATAGTTYAWTRAAVTGITPSTANGNGSINETLHNATTDPVTVTYVYTLTANGCTAPATEEVKVVVNPTPKLSSALTIAAICNDDTVNYTPASATTGTSFAWTRPVVTGITPATATGTGNINETLHNATSDPITVTYLYTLSANGCTAPTTEEVKVVVNPTPKLSSALTIAAICNDGTVNYTPVSATAGTSYTWTRAAVSHITPATGNGAGNINEILHNDGTDPVTVTYVYTLTANGCTAPATEEVKVVVNPAPKLSSASTITAICNDGTVNYTPASATTGTSFAWARPAVTGITPTIASGAGNINETLHNATSDPVTVTYVYTLTANGCTAPTTEEVKVVVNPTPKLSSALTIAAICNDGTVSYTPASTTAGTSFVWTRPAVPGITPATNNGVGNINETLHNATSDPITVTYVYTLSANGCTAPVTEEVKVVVNPTPKLSGALTIAAICNDGTVSYSPASTTVGTSFIWTRPAIPGITPATNNGVGNINEALHNATSDPITVTYQYTLSANGCTAPATEEVKVVVNPTPKLSSVSTITTVCNDGAINYTPTSATAGTSFAWTRPAVAGIIPATGNGTGNINETLHNTTGDPLVVTYVYTLTANGCTAPVTEEVIVTVNPTPKLSSALTIAAICNSTTVNYVPTSITAGTIFTWVRPAITGITPATGNGTGAISEQLTNTSADPITVTYLYALSANGCTAPATEEVKVVVNPTPKLSSVLNAAAICNNETFAYTPTSTTTGATYSWTRAAVAGITPATGNGTGAISEQLTNSGTAPIVVTYVYTLSANGCTNPTTEEVKVTVNPTAKLNNIVLNDSICNKSLYSYIPSSATAGVSYTWTRPAVAGILPAAGNGTGNISEVLENTTAAPVAVAYNVLLRANGCTNPATETIYVVVKPTPVLYNAPINDSICNKTAFNYTAASNTTNITYSWSRASVSGINPATASGTGATINEVLENTTANPVTVIYKVTMHTYGCADNTQDVSVVVKPTPALSSTRVIAATCNNTSISYTATSNTINTWFHWSRDAVAGISNPAVTNQPGYIIKETLENTTVNPVTVTYKVTMHTYGCTDNTQDVTVIVKPTPVLSTTTTPTAICNNEAFTYTATSATAGTVFSWTRPQVNGIQNATASGTTADINEKLINTTNAPVNVTYYISMKLDNCKENIQPVIVTVRPTADVVVPKDVIVCNNASTGLLKFNSNVAGTTYAWSNNNTSIGLAASGSGDIASFTATNPGAAPVSASITVTPATGTCPGIPQTFKVIVNPTPAVSQVADITICDAKLYAGVKFSGNVDQTTYTWTNDNTAIGLPKSGNGSIGMFTAINTGNNPITANIIVTPHANGCDGLATSFKIMVNPTPHLASPLNAGEICSEQQLSYSVASTVVNTVFDWKRDAVAGISNIAAAGKNNVQEQLTNTTDKPVIATYSYTLTANGCTNVETVKATVKPLPVPTITGTTTVCSAAQLSLQANSNIGADTYAWTGPNGFTANTQAITVQAADVINGNSYTVIVTRNGCVSHAVAQTVTVKPLPVVQITGTPQICENGDINLVANAGTGVTYSWTGPNNFSATGNNMLIRNAGMAAAGVYTVTVTGNGCAKAESIAVGVKALPSARISGSPVVCSGDLIKLEATDAGNNATYKWNGPANFSLSSKIVMINKATEINAGTYKLEVGKDGCSAETSIMVEVNPFPSIKVLSKLPACDNADILIQANSSLPNSTFRWVGPNNITSTQQELAISGYKGDTLKAYIYVTKNGCMSKDSIFLPVKKSPLVKMAGPLEVCQNAPLQQYLAFEQTGLPGKGAFSGPGITKEGMFNPSFAPGTFTLKYTYTTTDGCEDTKSVAVKVNPIPNVNAGPDKVMYEGFGTILNGSVRGSYASFEWNTPDTSHLLTPTVNPKVTTTYRLTARNLFGCMAFDDVQVQVVKFTIPNSFSPNGDGINDKWIINALDKYPDVRVEIFNRWGTRLYLCTGVYIPWDGTYNGQPVPTGTYYYLIDLKDGINRKPFSGWIEILR
ncbi:MAG: gliding motility-associated C-terminal domain-containing protein [Filimonas sp.]|nr:gliding motility-associated C-terminal domain-containing protein [Filimonas sp.]